MIGRHARDPRGSPRRARRTGDRPACVDSERVCWLELPGASTPFSQGIFVPIDDLENIVGDQLSPDINWTRWLWICKRVARQTGGRKASGSMAASFPFRRRWLGRGDCLFVLSSAQLKMGYDWSQQPFIGSMSWPPPVLIIQLHASPF